MYIQMHMAGGGGGGARVNETIDIIYPTNA